MPIVGFVRRRYVRLGKISLGEKTRNANSGAEYPRDLDHFRVPEEIAAVYGETPRAIPVRVPSPDIDEWFPYALKRYSTDGKLWCTGDGQEARCFQDSGEWIDVPCEYRECEHYAARKCTEIGRLQFIIPTVNMMGVYEIATGSWNTINNVYSEYSSAYELIQAAIGPEAAAQAITRLDFQLTREEAVLEFVDPKSGKRKQTTKWLVHLRPPKVTLDMLNELRQQCSFRPAGYLAAGTPDIEHEPDADEVPGELIEEAEDEDAMPEDLYPNAAPAGPDMGQKAAWAALLEQVQELGKDVETADKSAVEATDKTATSFDDLTADQATEALQTLTNMVKRWQGDKTRGKGKGQAASAAAAAPAKTDDVRRELDF